MTVNPEDANAMWQFEDVTRRTTQRLFAWSADEKVRNRRLAFRVALLYIMDGLTHEEGLAVAHGGNIIAEQFKAMQSWADYADLSKGLEIETAPHNEDAPGTPTEAPDEDRS